MNTLEQAMSLDKTLTVMGSDCTLKVAIACPVPNVLRLHYWVHNHSDLPLYLCNQLYKVITRDHTTGELVYAVQPNLANVRLESEHVVVGKTVVDVPEWMFVESHQIPCLSRILPGEEWEETFDLSLPLMPYTVYDYSPSTGKPVSRKLVFELGYFLASPHTEDFITSVRTSSGTAYYIDPFPASEQSLLAVGPWTEPVFVVSEV
ncbi:hypothetical protein GCM10022409_42910 [Hymenobacter glaciei]|uniref:Uncharacterized protein n=1 Tax=Hymenobacter glaciei TaxID=877209 RepID=A0ABP7UUS2_9BACT